MFPCEFCGAAFTLRPNLSIHMKKHKENENVSCESCDYRGTKELLSRHMKNVHSGVKFSCQACDSVFSAKKISTNIQNWSMSFWGTVANIATKILALRIFFKYIQNVILKKNLYAKSVKRYSKGTITWKQHYKNSWKTWL